MSSRLLVLSLLAVGLGGFVRAADSVPGSSAEPVKVSIRATDPIASETGPSTGVLTVSRSGSTVADLTVFYRTSGTAVAPGDYVPLPGSIVIPAGATSASIKVIPMDDVIAEEDETVVVTLISPVQPLAGTPGESAPLLYNIGEPGSAVVVIKDNDLGVASLPTVSIRATDPKAAEPANPGKITISRLGDITKALVVNYTVLTDPIPSPSSSAAGPVVLIPAATRGLDYQALPGTVTIPAGQKSFTITVQPIDDQLVEGPEHVTLKLVTSPDFNINQPDTATVIIADDDPVNVPPTVSLSGPAEGAKFKAGADITVTASASDTDDTIRQVDFLAGSKVVATVTGPQANGVYTSVWKSVPAGIYTLRAKATDQKGASAESKPIHISVIKALNLLPKVSIVAPTNGQTFTAPADIQIAAQASDSDGYVRTVQFYANGKSIGITTNNPASASPVNPFQITWKGVAVGQYVLTAKATDDQGGSASSASIRIKVVSNQVPTVKLTGPKDESSFASGATIKLAADAADPDGKVVEVSFLVNGKVIGSTKNAPYTFAWTDVPAGRYTVLAKAKDDGGATTTSGAVHVTVNQTIAGTTLIPAGAVWKYLDNGSDQGTAWRAPNFDDSKWASGPAALGYGDGNLATTVSYGPDPKKKFITTYFRLTFQVQNPAAFTNLIERVLRVDGAVVYLNGTQISHGNMPSGTITSLTLASSVLSGTAESTWHSANVDPKLLVSGNNVLAAEVHKGSLTSADLRFDLELIGNAQAPTPTPAATLTIDNPKDGATFTAPANITINATAIDPKGYISRVDFYANNQQIGTSQLMFFRAPDPGTPIYHTLQWNKVPAGKYVLTAKAKDSSGAEVVSPPVTVTVAAGPTAVSTQQMREEFRKRVSDLKNQLKDHPDMLRLQNSAVDHPIKFQLEPGRRYSIQVSTDLQDWQEVSIVESADGSFEFLDPEAADLAHRFYRAAPVDQ